MTQNKAKANIKTKILYLFLLLVILTSCRDSPKKMTIGEYKRWLAGDESTLKQTQRIAGYKFSVSYLTPDYVVLTEILKTDSKPTKELVDSLKKKNSKALTFILEIGPDESNTFDAITGRLSNKQEFYDRVEKLNFQLDENIELSLGDSIKYSPVLVHLENTYEIDPSRKVIVVFSVSESSQQEHTTDFDMSWNDTVYHTGIHHFIISADAVASSPVIIY